MKAGEGGGSDQRQEVAQRDPAELTPSSLDLFTFKIYSLKERCTATIEIK